MWVLIFRGKELVFGAYYALKLGCDQRAGYRSHPIDSAQRTQELINISTKIQNWFVSCGHVWSLNTWPHDPSSPSLCQIAIIASSMLKQIINSEKSNPLEPLSIESGGHDYRLVVWDWRHRKVSYSSTTTAPLQIVFRHRLSFLFYF